MKKIILMALFALATQTTFAQRFAYIDSEYILKAVPEYRAAQKQLEVLGRQWQKEIDDKNADASSLYKKLQAEQVMLTDDMRARREKEIKDKETEARDLSKKRFGYQGDLFQKRVELVKPIQDKMYQAVQKLAQDRSLDFVFDKGSDLIMLYSNSKFDRSDEVIELMGYPVPEAGARERPQQPAPGQPTSPAQQQPQNQTTTPPANTPPPGFNNPFGGQRDVPVDRK
jgi:outer membrane protein